MVGSRALIVAFAALALVFAVFLVTGCGGNGDDNGQLTAEEYFLALEALNNEYEAKFGEQEANLMQAMEGATSPEERVEVFVSFTQEGDPALEELIDGMAELKAPDELQELQAGTVSAGQTAIDTLNDLGLALSDVSTEEELQAVLAEGGTEEAFDRLNTFCFEAQAMADDAGVDVDYGCEEE